MHENPSGAEISDLLRTSRTVAVVGLSGDPGRPSYGVASELRNFGLKILPVNPNLKSPLFGEEPYSSLTEVPEQIDIVDVFRRGEFVLEIAHQAVEVGARALWMQLGVINTQAADFATENSMIVVINRCLAVDYRNLALCG